MYSSQPPFTYLDCHRMTMITKTVGKPLRSGRKAVQLTTVSTSSAEVYTYICMEFVFVVHEKPETVFFLFLYLL